MKESVKRKRFLQTSEEKSWCAGKCHKTSGKVVLMWSRVGYSAGHSVGHSVCSVLLAGGVLSVWLAPRDVRDKIQTDNSQ